jgi:SAM-dependent methyltransferase
MNSKFDPADYWEKRLSKNPNLRGTGHRAFSQEYNQWIYHSQRDCLSYLIQKYNIRFEGKNILDIGSGYGYYIEYFLEKSPLSISGLDITEASINFLKQKFPNLSFYKLDISEPIPVFDKKFDFISAISVMIHIVDDDKFVTAVNNLCNLLSGDGYLLLSDSYRKSFLPHVKHVKMRDKSSYESLFAGFDIEIVEILPVHYFIDKFTLPTLPGVLEFFKLYRWFYRIDNKLRQIGVNNGSGMKILLARRKLQS